MREPPPIRSKRKTAKTGTDARRGPRIFSERRIAFWGLFVAVVGTAATVGGLWLSFSQRPDATHEACAAAMDARDALEAAGAEAVVAQGSRETRGFAVFAGEAETLTRFANRAGNEDIRADARVLRNAIAQFAATTPATPPEQRGEFLLRGLEALDRIGGMCKEAGQPSWK